MKRTFYEGDGVLLDASAFMSTTDFPSPPVSSVPSRDDLVDGLLRQFRVPPREGPRPVMSQIDPSKVPVTIKQAMSSAYADFWAEAIISEWLSILGNDTWVLVDKQPWMKIIPCKWVFDIKCDGDGVPKRFKARLVAGGHKQTEGVGYEETYAPVSRLAYENFAAEV